MNFANECPQAQVHSSWNEARRHNAHGRSLEKSVKSPGRGKHHVHS